MLCIAISEHHELPLGPGMFLAKMCLVQILVHIDVMSADLLSKLTGTFRQQLKLHLFSMSF